MKVDIEAEAVESSEIALVGEYTTSDGPMLDDYFLVVVTEDKRCFVTPMPGDDPESPLSILRRTLNAELCCGLANRVDFTSRVMYPAELKDRPLFRCLGDVNADRGKGLLARWWSPPVFQWDIDPEVVDSAIRIKARVQEYGSAQPGATDNPDHRTLKSEKSSSNERPQPGV